MSKVFFFRLNWFLDDDFIVLLVRVLLYEVMGISNVCKLLDTYLHFILLVIFYHSYRFDAINIQNAFYNCHLKRLISSLYFDLRFNFALFLCFSLSIYFVRNFSYLSHRLLVYLIVDVLIYKFTPSNNDHFLVHLFIWVIACVFFIFMMIFTQICTNKQEKL